MKKSLLGLSCLLVLAGMAHADDLQITKTAQEAGIKSCLPTIQDMEKFFGEDNSYGSWSFWSKENPNKALFSVSIEIDFTDGMHLVDLTVAPTADGMCAYSYTRTWHSPKSCMAVAQEDFLKGYTYKTELNKKIGSFAKGDIKVFLMPAGDGCVVQKKEFDVSYKKQGS